MSVFTMRSFRNVKEVFESRKFSEEKEGLRKEESEGKTIKLKSPQKKEGRELLTVRMLLRSSNWRLVLWGQVKK